MRRLQGPLAAALVAVLCAACAASAASSRDVESRDALDRAERSGDLSKRLTPFAYFEEGDLFIAVDTRPAEFADKASLMPVGIALSNRTSDGKGFTLESFVLETADGKRYPVVEPSTFREDYDRSRADERLAEPFVEALNGKFPQDPYQSWTPFPASGQSAPMQRSVELGRYYWTRAMLYFPKPAEGVEGRQFNLIVTPNGSEESFVVTFFVR